MTALFIRSTRRKKIKEKNKVVGDKKSKNNGLKEHGSSTKQSLGIATDNILCGAYIKQCVCGFTVLHVDFFTCVEKS